LINEKIKNINYYLSYFKKKTEAPTQFGNKKTNSDSSDVHMYLEDISGNSAIDNAFYKNSIFCIKLFVDNLMNNPDDNNFNNCFDKALLLMI